MDIKEILTKSHDANISVNIPISDLLELFGKIAEEKKIIEEEKTHITASEFERMFGVSHVTRWRWEKAGIITGKRIAGKVYYSMDDVKKLRNEKA